jgi:hypothetical protein
MTELSKVSVEQVGMQAEVDEFAMGSVVVVHFFFDPRVFDMLDSGIDA